MAAVNEAYRVLSDPGRRAIYDRSLDGGGNQTGSAARPTGSAVDEDVLTTLRRPGYNYRHDRPGQPPPARFPWRFITVLGTMAVIAVLAGAVLFEGPAEREPDGVIRAGSCVEILANSDAREVRCTGEDDLFVERLIPRGERCPGGTTPHRDTLGRGMACVLPPGSPPPTTP